MIKILTPWALKTKIQKEITEKPFKHYFFIDYVDKSWQYWLRRKPLNEKKIKEESSQQKKLVMTTKPSSRIHSRNINNS